jgi:hypothetical protein
MSGLADWPAGALEILRRALATPTGRRTVEESRAFAYFAEGRRWKSLEEVWRRKSESDEGENHELQQH